MKKNIPKIIISAIAAICLSFTVILPASAQNNAVNGTYNFANQSGLNAAGAAAGYDTGTSATSLESIISTIIYVVLSFVGVIFFVLLIYGAFIWMTAQGNEEQVKKASGIVKDSIIGLAITLSAYAISYFLISYFWK